MKKSYEACLVVSLIAPAGACALDAERAADAGPAPSAEELPPVAISETTITVMTQNQYAGAELVPVLRETHAGDFNAALVRAIGVLGETDFRVRALLLAAQIAARQPDVVSLQEVADVTLDGRHEDGPTYRDHLADTLAALAAFGQSYTVAAQVQNWVVSAPVDLDLDGAPDGVFRLSDRNVILVRGSLTATPVIFDCSTYSLDGCNYDVYYTARTPIGDVPLRQGFVAVDVPAGLRNYRVVNTQLERAEIDPGHPFSPAIQAAQADQLLEGLDVSPPRTVVVVAADTRSTPDDEEIVLGPFTITPPYLQFVDAGFHDTWLIDPDPEPGETCCQAEALRNVTSSLSVRIDQIWSDVEPLVAAATVLGDLPTDRPLFGLWPSLHGAVAARLDY